MPASTQSPEPGIRFNKEKFLAALHHIIDACNDKPDVLGKTKLHKVLYFSDMLYFFVHGEPITGVEYIKAPYGPTARYLEWGLKELEARRVISSEIEDYFGLGKYRYRSKAAAMTNILSGPELALIDEVTAFVCERSAREISEFSHAQPWLEAAMGERIPYSSAYQLVPETTPTPADLEWARDQAESIKRYKRA